MGRLAGRLVTPCVSVRMREEQKGTSGRDEDNGAEKAAMWEEAQVKPSADESASEE